MPSLPAPTFEDRATTMLLAYFSPETTLPLATAFTAVVGFFTLVGRAPIRYLKRRWRALLARLRG